jgi:hypothetical protein
LALAAAGATVDLVRRPLPRHPRLVWTILALEVALASGSASGLVVCIGADGHHAIEMAAWDDCCPDHGAPTARIEAGNACACTDTPLLRCARLEPRPDATPAARAAVLPLPPPASPNPALVATRGDALLQLATASDLAARRTVVLVR